MSYYQFGAYEITDTNWVNTSIETIPAHQSKEERTDTVVGEEKYLCLCRMSLASLLPFLHPSVSDFFFRLLAAVLEWVHLVLCSFPNAC